MQANHKGRHRIIHLHLGLAMLAAALCVPLAAQAAWRYWVGDDTALGGPGTWNTSNANWSEKDTGTAPYFTWVTGDQPKFSGVGGVVTVEGTVTNLNRIYFTSTGYVLTGGTIVATGGHGISVANGAKATVYSALSTRYRESTPAWNGINLRNDVGSGTLIINSDLTQYNFNSVIIPYNGTIVLNGNNYSAGSVGTTGVGQPGVFILNGTHYGADSYTFHADATFGGTGTVQLANSDEMVNMLGKLTPGTATEIGTLKITVGDLKFNATAQAKFQVDLTADQADKVVVADQLTYAGTLNIDVTGARNSDASYTLFQYGRKTGAFTTVNINGVDPNKAVASYNGNTGVFTYHPLPPRGTLLTIQ